jgi:hypothetical protein
MAIQFPPAVQALIDDGVLIRTIETALRPKQLFRTVAAVREKFEGEIGETKTYTREGLFGIDTRPNTPGQDPTPQADASVEQWTVSPKQWADTKDTLLPNSYISIQRKVRADAEKLAIQAGTTIAHVARNKMYGAYMGGNAYISATKGSSTSIPVNTLQGFDKVMVNGTPKDVSASNPLTITINGVPNTVVGVQPNDASVPNGPGLLTVGTAVAVTQYQPVLAANRSVILRAGGGTSSNALTSTSLLTLRMIRQGVTMLRKAQVPTYDDGTYHMHLDEDSEACLFEDAEFKSMLTGVPDDHQHRAFAIGNCVGVTFLRNSECPNAGNTDATKDYIPGDTIVQNGAGAGLEIKRPILCGQTSIREVYIPVQAYVDESGVAPFGSVGEFTSGEQDAEAWLEGIRFMVRPPMDRLKQRMDQTWSFEGDWGIPTDSVNYVNRQSMYLRAVVMEHVPAY